MADEWEDYEREQLLHDATVAAERDRREPPRSMEDLREYLDAPIPRWRGVIPGLVTGRYFEDSEPSEATPVGAGYLRARPMLGGYYLTGAPGEESAANPPLYKMIVQAYSKRPTMVKVSNLMGTRETERERALGGGIRKGLEWAREDVMPWIKRLGAKRMVFTPEQSEGAAAKFGVDPRVRLYEMAARAKARRLPSRFGGPVEYEIELP